MKNIAQWPVPRKLCSISISSIAIATILLTASVAMAAESTRTQPPADIELAIAEQRCGAISMLVEQGFAAPAELAAAQQQLRGVERQREQGGSPLPEAINATDGKNSDHVSVFLLPGLSSYTDLGFPAHIQFSCTIGEKQNSQLLFSQEHSLRWLEAQRDFQAELLRRLESIDDSSVASTNEIQHHEQLKQLFAKQLATLEPVHIVSTRQNSESRGSLRDPALDRRSDPRQSDTYLPLVANRAVAVATVHAAMNQRQGALENAISIQKQRLKHLKRHLKALGDLPADSIVEREIQGADLQYQILKAELAQKEQQMTLTDLHKRYLNSLPNSKSDDRHATTSLSANATVNCVGEMFDHVAEDDSSVKLAAARLNLARHRLTALKKLSAEGFATWMEVSRAELAVVQAECERDAASEKQRIAKEAEALLKSIREQKFSDKISSHRVPLGPRVSGRAADGHAVKREYSCMGIQIA